MDPSYSRRMQIGLFAPAASPAGTPEYLHALATAAEAFGFRSLWVAEHVVLFDDYASQYPYAADGRIPAGGEIGFLDPFEALVFLAAHTTRIRLGTGICLVPQRNPVYTAKQVTTVDWLSRGRFDFGVGVGWLAEEFQALGVPFDRRGARTREYLEVMKRLWCDPVSSYSGAFYELPAARQYPKPVQRPHPPIWFGGESDPALRRVADQGQGWYPFNLEPDALAERLGTLDRLLAPRGRSRRDLQVAVCPYLRPVDLDLVKRYRDLGVDQVVLFAAAASPDALRELLERLANTILVPASRL
jgi:probable F420-dependent oxidoreductase